MGLTDRDDMTERPSNNHNPFEAPQPPRGPTICTIVLILVSVLFLVFKAAQWWQDHNTTRAAASVPEAQAVANPLPQSASGTYRPAQQRATAPQFVTLPAAGVVTKCVRNGKTSYSDAPCPSGATVSTLRLRAPTPVAVPMIHGAPVTTQAVAEQDPPSCIYPEPAHCEPIR